MEVSTRPIMLVLSWHAHTFHTFERPYRDVELRVGTLGLVFGLNIAGSTFENAPADPVEYSIPGVVTRWFPARWDETDVVRAIIKNQSVPACTS